MQLSKTAHTSAAAWSSDATNHWKDCTVCGYDTAFAAHTYDAENTCVCGDYKDKGVQFTLLSGTYTVTDYTGTATEVVIPATYKGVAVTSIGKRAFLNCSKLTFVTFANPNGWWRASDGTATSGTAIPAADLSSKSTAATYLTSTYRGYYWKRT